MSSSMFVVRSAAQIEGHTLTMTSGQEVAKTQLAVTACVDCCCWQGKGLPAIQNIFRMHCHVKESLQTFSAAGWRSRLQCNICHACKLLKQRPT